MRHIRLWGRRTGGRFWAPPPEAESTQQSCARSMCTSPQCSASTCSCAISQRLNESKAAQIPSRRQVALQVKHHTPLSTPRTSIDYAWHLVIASQKTMTEVVRVGERVPSSRHASTGPRTPLSRPRWFTPPASEDAVILWHACHRVDMLRLACCAPLARPP